MRLYLETERLILRDMVPEDYREVFLWTGDPDVARYMVYPVYTRAEDVRTWLEGRDPDDPDEYDAGIVLKATGELIGSGGLFYKPEDDLWTVGYNIRKDQWGHGYTPEAISAILEHVRKTRDVRGIQGSFANENHKSRRVMEKLGMGYAGETTITKLDGSETFPAKLYRKLFR